MFDLQIDKKKKKLSSINKSCEKKPTAHSQNVSADIRKWLIKHLFPTSSCKKQINKQNAYLLLTFLQSGSIPELDMQELKHVLPGQFAHSVYY